MEEKTYVEPVEVGGVTEGVKVTPAAPAQLPPRGEKGGGGGS